MQVFKIKFFQVGMKTRVMLALGVLSIFGSLFTSESLAAGEGSVYQVYRPIDLGWSDSPPPKDIYISLGLESGVKKGAIVDVYRRVSSYDNLTQKHMADHVIPVGRLRVLYSDQGTAIARLERFVSLEQEPALYPQTVMVGDVVRLASNK